MTDRNRFDTMAEAETRAEELTTETGEKHIAVLTDYAIKPYEAFRLPQVGDEATKAFNGDYYPVGAIERISDGWKTIWTEDGSKFRRVSETRWKIGGKKGAFSLIRGKFDQRNWER